VHIFKFPSGPLRTNALLCGCEDQQRAVVIDPSYGSTEPVVQKSLELHWTIDRILITHSHWDHIANVNDLALTTKAPVFIHPLDAPNLIHPGSDGIPFPILIRGFSVYHPVNDKDSFLVGNSLCVVIHTPGHSPGSVCYHFPEEKILITGDTLFEGCMGNIQLPTSNPQQMEQSLQILAELPQDTRIIPGHGRDTVLSKERWLYKQ
jgi:hydroxyacylglutathione hydrolase